MCCFVRPVVRVEKTAIFARMVAPGRQALVYEMQYASNFDNAMILPLPVARGTSSLSPRVDFVDLSHYRTFFADLEKGFPEPASDSVFRSKGVAVAAAPRERLEVAQVGSFSASFVPSISDFDRLDPAFAISPSTWAKLPDYKDYGFAVFRLTERSGRAHPMALEFDTEIDSALFFPTVHIHDGEVHARDHFDHRLFLQGDIGNDLATSSDTASAFAEIEKARGLVDGGALVRRATLSGELTNQDTIYALSQASLGVAKTTRTRDRKRASQTSVPRGEADRLDLRFALAPALALGGLAWLGRRKALLTRR